jgi:two-component system chemotaxis response regulator CheY
MSNTNDLNWRFNMRAIVIDDSRAMRGILKRILAGISFDVIEAADGREGLSRLAESGPQDLALVDWNMPNMNGFEFLKAIRADNAFASMVIVMVTTEVEMTQLSKALEAGANEYVMKPFTEEAMREKLALLGFGPVAA